MIAVFILLSFGLFIAGIITESFKEQNEYVSKAAIVFGMVCTIIMIFMVLKPFEPKAIDVYRHKTELKITYEGKIPVDTVVIFKKK